MAASGLFETLRIEEGSILRPMLHHHRLVQGARALRWNRGQVPDITEFERVIHECWLEIGAPRNARARLDCFPTHGPFGEPFRLWGHASPLAYSLTEGPRPARLIVYTKALPASESSYAKKTNRFFYDEARRFAHLHAATDALLMYANGSVAEADQAAVAFIKENLVHFPPLGSAALWSTARAYYERAGNMGGLELRTKNCTVENLLEAEGVVLINAIRGVQVAESLNGQRISPPSPDWLARARLQLTNGTMPGL